MVVQFSLVQLLSHVRLLETPWTAAHQASLSTIKPRRLFKLMSIESVMPFNHLFHCHPLLLSSVFPSISHFYVLIMRKASLSLLSILWNSAFRGVYLSFFPLPFASFLFTVICKASSNSYFGFGHFFFLVMVLITASCTMSRISVHSSTGTL